MTITCINVYSSRHLRSHWYWVIQSSATQRFPTSKSYLEMWNIAFNNVYFDNWWWQKLNGQTEGNNSRKVLRNCTAVIFSFLFSFLFWQSIFGHKQCGECSSLIITVCKPAVVQTSSSSRIQKLCLNTCWFGSHPVHCSQAGSKVLTSCLDPYEFESVCLDDRTSYLHYYLAFLQPHIFHCLQF